MINILDGNYALHDANRRKLYLEKGYFEAFGFGKGRSVKKKERRRKRKEMNMKLKK